MQNSILCFTLYLCFLANFVSSDIEEICLKETGISMEMVGSVRSKQGNPTEDVLCYLKCVFTLAEFVDESGLINIEVMKQKNYPRGSDEDRAKSYECLSALVKISNCQEIKGFMDCIPLNQN